jgi:hypothetical protein
VRIAIFVALLALSCSYDYSQLTSNGAGGNGGNTPAGGHGGTGPGAAGRSGLGGSGGSGGRAGSGGSVGGAGGMGNSTSTGGGGIAGAAGSSFGGMAGSGNVGGVGGGASAGAAGSGSFAGMGGAAGVGGAGNAAGSGGSPSACGTDPTLIDDMEDDNSEICQFDLHQSDQRTGGWYTVDDGSPGGTIFPPLSTPTMNNFMMSMIPGGRGSSQYAARLYGSGFTTYAFMGFDFDNSGAAALAYNASAFSSGGIHFFMMGNDEIEQSGAQISILTSNTVPVSQGGLCPVDPDDSIDCNQGFRFVIYPPAGEWYEVYLYFGTPPVPPTVTNSYGPVEPEDGVLPFYASQLISMHFSPLISYGSFDLWIDDISFFYP